jgi:hypothetical protein
MKTRKALVHLLIPRRNVVLVIALALIGVGTVVIAQQSRTFMGGEMSVHSDVQPFENKSFSCAPIQPLNVGDHFIAMVSGDQSWARDTASDRQGHYHVTTLPENQGGKLLGACPVLGMVTTSDGKPKTLYPAVLKPKADIAATNAVSSDVYQIEAKRPVKTGDQIAVLVIGGALLSIESDVADAKNSEAKPWFSIFKDDMKPGDRASTIEAWRIERKYIGQ